jgi:hypothetical protein
MAILLLMKSQSLSNIVNSNLLQLVLNNRAALIGIASLLIFIAANYALNSLYNTNIHKSRSNNAKIVNDYCSNFKEKLLSLVKYIIQTLLSILTAPLEIFHMIKNFSLDQPIHHLKNKIIDTKSHSFRSYKAQPLDYALKFVSIFTSVLLKASIISLSALFIFDAVQTLAGGKNLMGFHLIPEAMLNSKPALGIGIAVAAIAIIICVFSVIGRYKDFTNELNENVNYKPFKTPDLLSNVGVGIKDFVVKNSISAKNFVVEKWSECFKKDPDLVPSK